MDPEEKFNQYRIDQINTASAEELTLMLYRAVLANLGAVREQLRKDPSAAAKVSQLGRDILAALADGVNLEHPHGQTLRDLYLYCWRQLISASLGGEEADLESVQTVIGNLAAGLQAYQLKSASEPDTAVAASLNFAG